MYIKLRRFWRERLPSGKRLGTIEVALRKSVREGGKVKTKHVCSLGPFRYFISERPSDEGIQRWIDTTNLTIFLRVPKEDIPKILSEAAEKLKRFDYSR